MMAVPDSPPLRLVARQAQYVSRLGAAEQGSRAACPTRSSDDSIRRSPASAASVPKWGPRNRVRVLVTVSNADVGWAAETTYVEPIHQRPRMANGHHTEREMRGGLDCIIMHYCCQLLGFKNNPAVTHVGLFGARPCTRESHSPLSVR
jgi:hypothetical protein